MTSHSVVLTLLVDLRYSVFHLLHKPCRSLARRDVKKSVARLKTVISIAGPTARAISSKWFITKSSTASWRLMRRAQHSEGANGRQTAKCVGCGNDAVAQS